MSTYKHKHTYILYIHILINMTCMVNKHASGRIYSTYWYIYISFFRQHNKKPHNINMILILRGQHICINSTPNITLHLSCALLRASRHRGSTSQPVTSAFNASWTCKPHVGRKTTSEVQSSSTDNGRKPLHQWRFLKHSTNGVLEAIPTPNCCTILSIKCVSNIDKSGHDWDDAEQKKYLGKASVWEFIAKHCQRYVMVCAL